MPDFSKLRANRPSPVIIDPEDIFRRMPKPPGINDLYTSQGEVLRGWFARRTSRDLVIKLHTGGGKTLVGLLIAQSTLNETREPVIYLTPNNQLVSQTLAKAKAYRINAVPYVRGERLPDAFANGQAVLIANYSSLFNGQSKFGVRDNGDVPVRVGGIIVDDAHTSFGILREQFTLAVVDDAAGGQPELYRDLCTLFRTAFQETDRVGTFDEVISGNEDAVLEVPYWAWHARLEAVRELLRTHTSKFPFVWPFLRDRLHLCHAFVGKRAFTITPMVLPVDTIPTFSECTRRVYMSATIADDSSIIRTFDADPEAVATPLSSKSLAGVSERMILIPELMPFKIDITDAVVQLARKVAATSTGVAVLVPSTKAMDRWKAVGKAPEKPAEVDRLVAEMQEGREFGPVVLANRYDGIDLPGDACRFLVLDGLPKGTSDYELFRASALYGGSSINSALAQRIEQGIGRGARGAGDYCVVMLLGHDLVGWISRDANFKFLTSSTHAQLDMGMEVSRATTDRDDLGKTIKKCLGRDGEWVQYHAEELANHVDNTAPLGDRLEEAGVERKALALFADGLHGNAINRINKFLDSSKQLDLQTRGWFEQLAARIADHWKNRELSQEFQRSAYSNNRNLQRPAAAPPYRPLSLPGEQAQAIVARLQAYRMRRGFMRVFDEAAAKLVPTSSSNQFEQALADLGEMIGFTTERPENTGEPGSDVLWLMPDQLGLIIEAKSRKKELNPLNKGDHGQILVAEKWFLAAYPAYKAIRVSVHLKAVATKASVPSGLKALTYEKLQELIGEARTMLASVCDSNLPAGELVGFTQSLLSRSSLTPLRLPKKYLVDFKTQ